MWTTPSGGKESVKDNHLVCAGGGGGDLATGLSGWTAVNVVESNGDEGSSWVGGKGGNASCGIRRNGDNMNGGSWSCVGGIGGGLCVFYGREGVSGIGNVRANGLGGVSKGGGLRLSVCYCCLKWRRWWWGRYCVERSQL